MIPIISISFLTVMCLYFVWDSFKQNKHFKEPYRCALQWELHALNLRRDLNKRCPQRDSKGRFVKGFIDPDFKIDKAVCLQDGTVVCVRKGGVWRIPEKEGLNG